MDEVVAAAARASGVVPVIVLGIESVPEEIRLIVDPHSLGGREGQFRGYIVVVGSRTDVDQHVPGRRGEVQMRNGPHADRAVPLRVLQPEVAPRTLP